MRENDQLFSRVVKAGRNTYFVDVKEAKNGSKYLALTEYRTNGEEKRKTTIRIFGSAVADFRQAVNDAAINVS